jgi:Uncharacterized protein conserved in bacteria
MKTFWTIILGLFLLVGCKSNSTDTLGNWVKKNSFEGTPRGSAVSFVIGDKSYIGLGYNSDYETGDPDVTNEGYRKDFWVYNASSDKWNKIASFPGVGRVNAVGFAANGKGYVTTGYDGNNKLKDTWEYDPTSDKWTQKDDFASTARTKAVAFGIGNFGYVGTGYGSDGSDKSDFYKFDPTKATGSQWTKVQSIGGEKRRGATAFVYNNKAYVCTGSNNNSKLTDMWEYDPSADSWTKKISLTDNSDWTITRENASSFVLDTKAYVFLGSSSSNLKTCWEYDFANDTWNQKNDFEGAAREFAVAFTVAGKAIVATGQSGTSSYMDDVWEFRPYEALNTED